MDKTEHDELFKAIHPKWQLLNFSYYIHAKYSSTHCCTFLISYERFPVARPDALIPVYFAKHWRINGIITKKFLTKSYKY